MKRILVILACLIALAAATQSVFATAKGKAEVDVDQVKDSPGI